MKKWQAIALAVLIIAGISFGVYRWESVQEITETNLTIKLENQYQRSFHQLAYGMDNINAQLAQMLVTTSHRQTLLGLANLWRETYGAIGDLSALPAAMNELENTDKLLNDVAEYSYYLIRQNILSGKLLDEKDFSQLEDFYQRSKVVKQELSDIEAAILNENLRFSDVEPFLLNEENATADSNRIVSAFRSIESQVNAFPELNFAEGVRKIEPEPRPIAGEMITQMQAIEIAEEFYTRYQKNNEKNIESRVEFVSEGGKLPVYGVRIYHDDSNEPIFVEVSQKGGHILQMYHYRDLGTATLSEADSLRVAEEFLQEQGFPTMKLVDAQNDGMFNDLTYVPVQEGAYIYSDMVKVQIALDNGEVMNYDQTSYITHHYERTIAAPRLSADEVRRGMNPNFSVSDIRLALIPDEYSVREILTYEVRGSVVEEDFAIFVDGQTGEEVRIVRLTEPQEYLVNAQEDNSK